MSLSNFGKSLHQTSRRANMKCDCGCWLIIRCAEGSGAVAAVFERA